MNGNLIDACGMECSFREHLAERDLHATLNAPSHPLRTALQKLHTLEPIRIIEGKG